MPISVPWLLGRGGLQLRHTPAANKGQSNTSVVKLEGTEKASATGANHPQDKRRTCAVSSSPIISKLIHRQKSQLGRALSRLSR